MIVFYIHYYFLLLLGLLSWILSFNALRYHLSKFISNLLNFLPNKRQGITQTNLLNSFPTISKTDLQNIQKITNTNLFVTMLEFLSVPYRKKDQVVKQFEFPDDDKVKEVFNGSKGSVLLSAHFGNWELAAMSAGVYYNKPITLIVKAQKNPLVSNLFNKYRTLWNNKVVDMGNAAKVMIDTVKNGGTIGLLADQAANPHRDIFIEFFGRPAVTYEAPASLALRYKVPIIVMFAIRKDDGNYKIYHEILDTQNLTDTPENRAKVMSMYNTSLENIIRQYPEQWTWQHNRWKYNPEDYKKGNQ
ncbi:MAG: lysophospholipid acyltransferase family protein [Candidatus Kapaibacterium sp.]|nr:lysophospholipid acyltransferase family protein [Bacteroidota bacterium]